MRTKTLSPMTLGWQNWALLAVILSILLGLAGWALWIGPEL